MKSRRAKVIAAAVSALALLGFGGQVIGSSAVPTTTHYAVAATHNNWPDCVGTCWGAHIR